MINMLVQVLASDAILSLVSKLALVVLRALVKSSKNELDDQIVDEVERALIVSKEPKV